MPPLANELAEKFSPLRVPLTPEQFCSVAPSIITWLIQFLLNVTAQHSATFPPSTSTHVISGFLTMAGKCDLGILPSLSRITEYLAQQCSSKNAIVIIREILQKIPPKLLQKRFQVRIFLVYCE